MLSKLATRNLVRNRLSKLLPTSGKAFSTLAVQEDAPKAQSDNFKTLWEMSALRTAEAAAKVHAEESYLADLKQSSVDRAAFKPVTVNENDHSTIKQIKNKINAIVE